MKTVLPLLFVLGILQQAFSQTTGMPYCMHDDNGTYHFASVDLSTGAINNIAAINGMQHFVSGSKYFINTDGNTYTCGGHDGNNARLYTMKISDGSVLHSPVFGGVIVGLKYDCKTQKVYAIEEVSSSTYNLVTVDVSTGSTTFVGAIAGVSGYVSESFALDAQRGLYHFKGLAGAAIYQYSIDVNSGLIVSNPVFADNVAALQYNCSDSLMYGLWEDGTDYKLETIDATNGTHNTVGILPGIAPGYVTASSCMTSNGEYTYRGFTGPTLSLITIDVATATILNNVSFSGTVHGFVESTCCNTTMTDLPVLEANAFQLYPNPSITGATLAWKYPISKGKLELFDALGRLVHQETNVEGTQYLLNRGNLPTGIYSLHLTVEHKTLYRGQLMLN